MMRKIFGFKAGKMLLLLSGAASFSACLSGCETMQTVQPWEKGKLARQEMKFDGDPLDAKFVEHIYFSKEAASGGAGVGGGGCGCN
jgi:hypothetical protein